MKKLYFLNVLLLVNSSQLFGQDVFPDYSPQSTLKQEIGNTNIEINYSKTAVRGRKIFGELVPFGKLWRTGAADCSTISFDRQVIIEGHKIPKGKYSIFTIPNLETWVIILNSDTTLYGAYDYDQQKDVARFEVRADSNAPFRESLQYDLDFIPNNAQLSIAWENFKVSFLMETSTDKEVLEYIENELLTQKEKSDQPYNEGASFLLFHNMDIQKALLLSNYALRIRDSENVRGIRSDIFTVLKEKGKAASEIAMAIQLVKNSDTLSQKDKEISFDFWNTKLKELNN